MIESSPILTLDIDQTLAGDVVISHLRYYSERLKLGLTEEEIVACRGLAKTFDHSGIAEFRTKDEATFQSVREEIRTSADLHKGLPVVGGALEGVRRIIGGGAFVSGGYYTVRPESLKTATREWLEERGFPDSDNVTICKDHRDKLIKVHGDHLGRPGKQPTFLVDDSYNGLFDAARELVVEGEIDNFDNLVLVVFRADFEVIVDPHTGLRSVGLPSWDENHINQRLYSLLHQVN